MTTPDETPPQQTQLTVREYGHVKHILSTSAQSALLDAIGGYVTSSARTTATLRRYDLIRRDDYRLTPYGWKVRAALVVQPGTLASRIVQTLIDAGFVWKMLPGSGSLRGTFTVESEASDSAAFVICRTLNGAADIHALVRAENILVTAGFRVEKVVDILPRLSVSEGG